MEIDITRPGYVYRDLRYRAVLGEQVCSMPLTESRKTGMMRLCGLEFQTFSAGSMLIPIT